MFDDALLSSIWSSLLAIEVDRPAASALLILNRPIQAGASS